MSDNPSKIHLLLSGGGYRATLFHLGILRFLYEHRLLGQSNSESMLQLVSLVSGVSGGSITAAHFACNRDEYIGGFDSIAEKLIGFVKGVNIRWEVLALGNSIDSVLSKDLIANKLTFNDIKSGLNLVILGTSLKTGNGLAFHRGGVDAVSFDEAAGASSISNALGGVPVSIAKAVSASMAFPPFFPPLDLRKDVFSGHVSERDFSESLLSDDAVADGGIRDNIGIDWYKCSQFRSEQGALLVMCDAGRPFDWDMSDRGKQSVFGWGRRFMRSIDIMMFRMGLLDTFRAENCETPPISLSRIGGLPASEDLGKGIIDHQLPSGVAELARKIPTDLVCLGDAQAFAITRLGYDLAGLHFGKIAQIERRDVSLSFWEKLVVQQDMRLLENSGKKASGSLQRRLKAESQGWGRFSWLRASWVGYWQLPIKWWRLHPLSLLLILLLGLGCLRAYEWFFPNQENIASILRLKVRDLRDEFGGVIAKQWFECKNLDCLQLLVGQPVTLRFNAKVSGMPNFVTANEVYEFSVQDNRSGAGTLPAEIRVDVDFEGNFLSPHSTNEDVVISGVIKEIVRVSDVRVKVVISDATYLKGIEQE